MRSRLKKDKNQIRIEKQDSRKNNMALGAIPEPATLVMFLNFLIFHQLLVGLQVKQRDC